MPPARLRDRSTLVAPRVLCTRSAGDSAYSPFDALAVLPLVSRARRKPRRRRCARARGRGPSRVVTHSHLSPLTAEGGGRASCLRARRWRAVAAIRGGVLKPVPPCGELVACPVSAPARRERVGRRSPRFKCRRMILVTLRLNKQITHAVTEPRRTHVAHEARRCSGASSGKRRSRPPPRPPRLPPRPPLRRPRPKSHHPLRPWSPPPAGPPPSLRPRVRFWYESICSSSHADEPFKRAGRGA